MYYRRTIHILTMFRRLTLSIESCLNIIRGYIIRFMLALLIASLWHRYALACLVSHAWSRMPGIWRVRHARSRILFRGCCAEGE